MQRDAHYMLEIDPDRRLYNFRRTAKLPSTAQPLGNWEAPSSGLRGHLVGHYLSACALMHASTGDEPFRQRADPLVSELAKCQAALGSSGYLSAFSESVFDELEAGAQWLTLALAIAILIGSVRRASAQQPNAKLKETGASGIGLNLMSIHCGYAFVRLAWKTSRTAPD